MQNTDLMSEHVIESESPGSKQRFPWFTPMVVMWTTVVIVIALIVLGTWLNKRKAAFDTHEARERLESVLKDAPFTPQQKAELTAKSETLLENSGAGVARRETATRWFNRIERSVACAALHAKVAEMDAIVAAQLADDPAAAERAKQWTLARRQVLRVIHAADRGDADPTSTTRMLDKLISAGKEVSADEVKAFGERCKATADKAEAPAEPPAFDLYESLTRGVTESAKPQ